MPKIFQGKPDITEQDPRGLIHPSDEQRLLGLAASKGIQDSDIGTFHVVLISDYPYEVSDNEYQTFSIEELIEQAAASDRWFYDAENTRIIGTIPPTKQILEKFKDGNIQVSGREVETT
jgi:hypothetical protein